MALMGCSSFPVTHRTVRVPEAFITLQEKPTPPEIPATDNAIAIFIVEQNAALNSCRVQITSLAEILKVQGVEILETEPE